MKPAVLLLLLVLPMAARGADQRLELIRNTIAGAPRLELSTEAGTPKFQVVRFNVEPRIVRGQRYGLVRFTYPPGEPRPLVWMFSDAGNIEEYEIMPVAAGEPIRGNLRAIIPPLANFNLDDPNGRGPAASALPRPWDYFELHVLGIPAELLRPGEDYVIWFRFSDRRPTDLLLAATVLDPALKLAPADLPNIMALPSELAQ